MPNNLPSDRQGHGLEIEHVRAFVAKPALYRIDLWSAAAENLVLGTMMQESGLRALKQYGAGPALGLAQMEPATHTSLWVHSIPGIAGLAGKLIELLAPVDHDRLPVPNELALTHNLLYAAAMCRVRYYIVPQRLPLQNDPMGMAVYWLRYYNAGGKGTIAAALPDFQRACQHLEVP
jgi:hypothetical protein